MDAYELCLPYPPSNNHYKGIVRNPKKPKYSRKTGKPLMQFFIPAKTTIFQNEVAFRFKEQKGIPMGDKKLVVELDVYPPKGKRGYDLDNYPKVIFDSLQKAGAFKNDYNICSLRIVRKSKYEQGMVMVRICAIEM